MSIVLFEVGAYVLLAKYIQLNKGVWQFRRRIPDDVAKHYPGKKVQIRFSLKTRDKQVAAKQAHQHAIQQDALWKSLRTGEIDFGPEVVHAAMAILERFKLTPGEWEAWNAAGLEPDEFIQELEYQADLDPMVSREENAHRMKHDLPPPYRMAADLFYGSKAPLFMSEALKQFQQLKGEKPDTKSANDRCRVVQDFTTLFGDLPIDQYTRENANHYVSHLREKGNKSTTIRRRVNSISAIMSLMLAEGKLPSGNVFHNIQIANLGDDSTERSPFSTTELKTLQQLAFQWDDEMRWAIALMSDTGMRVSEAIGLQIQDVHLDTDIPYVEIQMDASRRLKNKASVRTVPLVGAALWAAQRAVKHAKDGFLFPRYIDFKTTPPKAKGTVASAGLNDWIKARGIDKTCHSFRHSATDRLRSVEAPYDLRNAISGWKTRGTGAHYGDGYSIETKHKYLKMIVFTELVSCDGVVAPLPDILAAE